MRHTRFLSALLAVAVVAVVATDARAFYDPKHGRFLQRDPIGTRDIVVHYQPGGPRIVVAPGVANAVFVDAPGRLAIRGFIPRDPMVVQPAVSRFVPRDPVSIQPPPTQAGLNPLYADGMNLYEYAESNPTNRLDPQGLMSNELTSITIKRKHIKWAVVFGKEEGDGYGHWWIEFEGESYGWWPKDHVPGLWATIVGVPGELNGQTHFGGTPTRDPDHGDTAEETFHPWRAGNGLFGVRTLHYGIGKGSHCSCAFEYEIRDCARAFAADFAAKNASWRYPFAPNCHSFQSDMMRACCMKKK